MIIGLSGEKGSGKDTVAAYLVKEYGFERRAFADPLKRSVAALLDIPFHEVDKFKNDPTVHVTLGYENRPALPIVHEINKDPQGNESLGKRISPDAMWSPIREGQTFRHFLQRYGTESHRDVFGEDFWVDKTLPKDGFYASRKIVVTDLRFENEADRVWALDGHIVRVHRDSIKSDDTHPSENPIFLEDFPIYNNGTMGDLWLSIELMLTWVTEQENAGEETR